MARPTAIRSLADTASDKRKNWLVYADSGVGKTVLAGTLDRSLFLTVEANGTESARMFGSTADDWAVETWDELQRAYKWLKQGGVEDYDWVILDSLSEMEEACWNARIQEKNRSEMVAIQDYPIVWRQVKQLVDAFNRLPVNVLYTAQTMRLAITDEEEDDSTLLLPLVGSTKRGDLAQKVCGMVTLVGYLDTRKVPARDSSDKDETEEIRRLWVKKTPHMFAKTRHHRGIRYVDFYTDEDDWTLSPTLQEFSETADVGAASGNKKKGRRKAA